MTSDLYSADMRLRFAASLACEGSFPPVSWPRGCRGAVNGWLMLVGPSPGRQDTDSDIWPGGPGRPWDEVATVGASAGVVDFGTNRARNARWNMLSEAVFGDAGCARALTCVANLDWGHHSDHKHIPIDFLEQGCEVVAELIRTTKARVVITLVRRTWEVLAPYLTRNHESVQYAAATELDACVIRFAGSDASTIVIRSPQHPSRHFFNSHHAATLHKEVQAFLASDGTQTNHASGGITQDWSASMPLPHHSTHIAAASACQPTSAGRKTTGRSGIGRAEEPAWAEQRRLVVKVLGKHGYTRLTADQRVARGAEPGPFDELIAVHPEANALTLYVRRGGARYLERVAADLGYPLKGAALPIPDLDIAQLDLMLGTLRDSLRRHRK